MASTRGTLGVLNPTQEKRPCLPSILPYKPWLRSSKVCLSAPIWAFCTSSECWSVSICCFRAGRCFRPCKPRAWARKLCGAPGPLFGMACGASPRSCAFGKAHWGTGRLAVPCPRRPSSGGGVYHFAAKYMIRSASSVCLGPRKSLSAARTRPAGRVFWLPPYPPPWLPPS